jgi:hypothetical protein
VRGGESERGGEGAVNGKNRILYYLRPLLGSSLGEAKGIKVR